ncbi:heme-binding protein [Nocardioides cynanchi]|uniref:heme-binding protein n=1 Tax=Nocardioides cynanchi TaxID=2558918 RepID=UPI001245253C|nr:heme-binding protein [Nocardioides cynanchi]
MHLASDFAFEPVPAIADTPAHPFTSIDDPLGPLAALVGTWTGTGFNTIWRPHFPSGAQDRFLELNLTSETLVFEEIPGAIPNRGLDQKDIEMFGVHYLQQISDSALSAGIHLEPGIWATVPATTAPKEPPTVVRMASIPHGTAILVQGKAFTVAGPPVIADTDIIPFGAGDPGGKGTFANAEQAFPELDLSKKTKFRQPSDATTQPSITQAMVKNPNLVLQKAIHGQDIVRTTVLRINTHTKPESVGTANTFFLGENASANHVDATFWIEKVKKPHTAGHFLQLQYSQTVMLDFNGLRWPHVSVATLRKTVPSPAPARNDLPSGGGAVAGREVELG